MYYLVHRGQHPQWANQAPQQLNTHNKQLTLVSTLISTILIVSTKLNVKSHEVKSFMSNTLRNANTCLDRQGVRSQRNSSTTESTKCWIHFVQASRKLPHWCGATMISWLETIAYCGHGRETYAIVGNASDISGHTEDMGYSTATMHGTSKMFTRENLLWKMRHVLLREMRVPWNLGENPTSFTESYVFQRSTSFASMQNCECPERFLANHSILPTGSETKTAVNKIGMTKRLCYLSLRRCHLPSQQAPHLNERKREREG